LFEKSEETIWSILSKASSWRSDIIYAKYTVRRKLKSSCLLLHISFSGDFLSFIIFQIPSINNLWEINKRNVSHWKLGVSIWKYWIHGQLNFHCFIQIVNCIIFYFDQWNKFKILFFKSLSSILNNQLTQPEKEKNYQCLFTLVKYLLFVNEILFNLWREILFFRKC
jgi:hypothetical protein